MRLGTTNLVLLAGLGLTLGLVGLPAFLRVGAPADSLRGVVVDGRGFGISDAAVFLFSEEHLQLVEETRSDENGDYAFHLDVPRPRVFVRPARASGLLSAWGPPAEEALGRQNFVLRRARPLEVRVQDEHGLALPGAEVRVYERRGTAAVVSLGRTDAHGRVELLAPATADVAVLAPDAAGLARWRFECAVAEEGAQLAFTLPAAQPVSGRVLDAGRPCADIVVVAWEDGPDGAWNGFTRSDAEGRFTLPLRAVPGELRALDPAGRYLPARLRLAGAPAEPLALTLEPGRPLTVRTTRAGLPLPSLVWSWSSASEAWSWCARTSPSGRATLPVSSRYGIHADPLDPSHAPLEAWDMPFEDGTLLLEAFPER